MQIPKNVLSSSDYFAYLVLEPKTLKLCNKLTSNEPFFSAELGRRIKKTFRWGVLVMLYSGYYSKRADLTYLENLAFSKHEKQYLRPMVLCHLRQFVS